MTTHHDAGHRTDHGHEELEDHDLGLSHDLPKILARRGLLTVFGGVGFAVVAGCAADDASSTSTATPSTTSSSGDRFGRGRGRRDAERPGLEPGLNGVREAGRHEAARRVTGSGRLVRTVWSTLAA